MLLCCGRERVTLEVRPPHLPSSLYFVVTRGMLLRLTSTEVRPVTRTHGSRRSSSPAVMTGSSSGMYTNSCRQRIRTQEQGAQLWPEKWETYPHADWSNIKWACTFISLKTLNIDILQKSKVGWIALGTGSSVWLLRLTYKPLSTGSEKLSLKSVDKHVVIETQHAGNISDILMVTSAKMVVTSGEDSKIKFWSFQARDNH